MSYWGSLRLISNRAWRARKLGLAPIPLEAVQPPGWSAQRHRQGRRCGASQRAQKKSPPQARPGSPYDGRHHPTNRTAARKPRSPIARPSAAPRGGRNFVAAPPATGPSPKKNLAPRSLTARLGDSFYFAKCEIVESLLRRGARCRSALESWSWLGNRRELPLRRTGGASRHAGGAIRLQKHSSSARLGKSFPINSSFIGLISS